MPDTGQPFDSYLSCFSQIFNINELVDRFRLIFLLYDEREHKKTLSLLSKTTWVDSME